MHLDVSHQATHDRVLEFVTHLVRRHNCAPGPFATFLETAEHELARVVADRDQLAAALASMTDRYTAAMEQVVTKTCQAAAHQKQIAAHQKQNMARAREVKEASLRVQDAEERAARAEARVAALEAKVAVAMQGSPRPGPAEGLVSNEDMVRKIQEWRTCARKAQCDLQKQEMLTKRFAVRLAVYEPHIFDGFLEAGPTPGATSGESSGVPVIVLTPPSWEFTPEGRRDIDPELLSPPERSPCGRTRKAPRPQTSRFWSSPAPSMSMSVRSSRKTSRAAYSSTPEMVTTVQSTARIVRPLPRRAF